MAEIRPFRSEDREAIVAFGNLERPPHRQMTVAGWERNDGRRTGEEAFLRLVIGDPAVAFLEAVDLNTTPWKLKDVCWMELRVAPAHRCRGLGGRLYDRALAWAQSRGAAAVMTAFRERSAAEPALGFLTRRGFAEQEREQPSYLELARFDAAAFAPAVARVERQGIRLISFAEAGDTGENRRRLYDLFCPLMHDIPRRDNQPFEMEPFPQFERMMLARPEWQPGLFLLAEDAGTWIGMTMLMPRPDSDVAMQWMTGVVPTHRGRGIATALKARNYAAAQAAGVRVVVTDNHVDNGPMLSVNRKFGFVPEAPGVVYKKCLSST